MRMSCAEIREVLRAMPLGRISIVENVTNGGKKKQDGVALRTVAWALVHNVGEELGLEASWSPK